MYSQSICNLNQSHFKLYVHLIKLSLKPCVGQATQNLNPYLKLGFNGVRGGQTFQNIMLNFDKIMVKLLCRKDSCQNVLHSKFMVNTSHYGMVSLITFLFFYRFVEPLTVASPHGWLATLMRVCKIFSRDPPAWESAANSLSEKTGRTSPWVSSYFILQHTVHKYVIVISFIYYCCAPLGFLCFSIAIF